MSAFNSSPLHARLWDLLSSNSLSELSQLLSSQRIDKSLLNDLLLRSVKAWTLKNNSDDSIDFLLSHGASINCFDELGKTPLMIASEKGYIELVQNFLSSNVDQLDQRNRSALYYAIDNNSNSENVDIVGMLVERTSERTVNHLTKEGSNALLKACEKGFLESVRVLLQKANPNVYDERTRNTPLHIAIKTQNLPIIESLLAAYADFTVRDANGQSAIEQIQNIEGLYERLRDIIHRPRAQLDLMGGEPQVNNKPKPVNKFIGLEEPQERKKPLPKNFSSMDNMEPEFFSQGGYNSNKMPTGGGFQTSPQHTPGTTYKGFPGKKQNKGQKNYFNSEENMMPQEDFTLECELMKELGIQNQKQLMNTGFARPVNKAAASPSSQTQGKGGRFTNRNNMNSQPGGTSSSWSNNGGGYYGTGQGGYNNNLMGLQGAPMLNSPGNTPINPMNMNNTPKSGVTPMNTPIVPSQMNPMMTNSMGNPPTQMMPPPNLTHLPPNNQNPPTNNMTPPPITSSNLPNNHNPSPQRPTPNQTPNNPPSNPVHPLSNIPNNLPSSRPAGGHRIVLDLTQPGSFEVLHRKADLLVEESKRKRLQEELALERKKIAEMESTLEDMKTRLAQKETELEKVTKELEKASKQQPKREASTSTEWKPCSIDFTECLTVKEPAKTQKLRNVYQSTVSLGPAIELRLNEEISMFQKEVEKFHVENHVLFERLIAKVTESISSAISDCTV